MKRQKPGWRNLGGAEATHSSRGGVSNVRRQQIHVAPKSSYLAVVALCLGITIVPTAWTCHAFIFRGASLKTTAQRRRETSSSLLKSLPTTSLLAKREEGHEALSFSDSGGGGGGGGRRPRMSDGVPPVKNGVRRKQKATNEEDDKIARDSIQSKKAENSSSSSRNIGKKNGQQPKPPRRNSSERLSPTSRYKEILSHRLLTKAQEQRLGRQLRRAILLKKQVEDLVDSRQLRRLELEREEGAVHGGWDCDNDDDFSLSSSLGDEWDGFLMQAPTNGKFDGRVREDDCDDEDNELLHLSIVHGIDPNRNLEAFESKGLFSIDGPSAGQVGGFFGTDQVKCLTDREIVEDLGIPGGREELDRILIEGALAREELIMYNTRLVVSIAKNWFRNLAGSASSPGTMREVYSGSWTIPSLDEVIQDGIMGLAAAAERFEPDRNLKFSTYATYYITNEVRRCFHSARAGALRIPFNYFVIEAKYSRLVKEHYRKTGKNLDLNDAAERMGLRSERLAYILRRTCPLIQLDGGQRNFGAYLGAGKGGEGPEGSTSAETLADSLECSEPTPESYVERSLLRQCLENALASELTPHERDVLRLRHGLDDGVTRTAKEVVESCGGMISVGDVRSAERRAYSKLRQPRSIHTIRLRSFEDFAGFSIEPAETVRKTDPETE